MIKPEVTKENIAELFNSVLAEEEYFDRLGQLPDVEGEVYDEAARGRATLMRSAGVPPGVGFAAEVHEGALAVADERLKRFGCDFIKAAYMLMDSMGMDGDARDFILIILAASGGTNRRLIITDIRLAEISGYAERTVRRKRKAYLEWQNSEHGWTAVRVHEGKYDHEANKNIPTEYEVPFADSVIKGLREWRTFYQRQLNQPDAPDRDAEIEEKDPTLWAEMREQRATVAYAESTSPEVFKKIMEKVIPETLDCEPGKTRKSQKAVSPDVPKEPKDKLAVNEARMLTLIAECRDESRRRGRGAYSWWTDFKRKVALVLAEQTPGLSDPDEEE